MCGVVLEPPHHAEHPHPCRVSTAMLLAVLAHERAVAGAHWGASVLLLLLMLDVGSHWVQMLGSA